jgi:pyruvate-formate lyase-activating enzyme
MIRAIKNKLIGMDFVKNSLIYLINTKYFGDVYDYFYFKRANKLFSKSDHLAIETSNVCNLRCIMCPYQKMTRKKEVMSMENFKKILDEASKLGYKKLSLNLYNEPFLDKNIFEKIVYAKSKDFFVMLYSNGTTLNETIRKDILKSNLDLIRFSFDGATKETYEKIRRGSNFKRVKENINLLLSERKRSTPRIEIYLVLIDSVNKKEIKEFKKMWKHADATSIYPVDSRYNAKLVNKDFTKLKPYPCFNPRDLTIMSSGKVALCCDDYDGKIILGDTKTQSLKEILESKKVKDIFESHVNRNCKLPACVNCSNLYLTSAFKWWGGF